MLASEYIKEIQKAIDEKGDHPIYLQDPDTGWGLDVGVEYSPDDKYGSLGKDGELILITAGYR